MRGGKNTLTNEDFEGEMEVSTKIGYNVNPASEMASDLFADGMTVEEAKDQVVKFVNEDLDNVDGLSKEDLFDRPMSQDMRNSDTKAAKKAVVFNTLNNMKVMLKEAVEADRPDAQHVEKAVRKALAKQLRGRNNEGMNIQQWIEESIDYIHENEIPLVELRQNSKREMVSSRIDMQTAAFKAIAIEEDVMKTISDVEIQRIRIKEERMLIESVVKVDISAEVEEEGKQAIVDDMFNQRMSEIDKVNSERPAMDFKDKAVSLQVRLDFQEQLTAIIEEAGGLIESLTKKRLSVEQYTKVGKVRDKLTSDFKALKEEIEESNVEENLGFDDVHFEKTAQVLQELGKAYLKNEPVKGPIDGKNPDDVFPGDPIVVVPIGGEPVGDPVGVVPPFLTVEPLHNGDMETPQLIDILSEYEEQAMQLKDYISNPKSVGPMRSIGEKSLTELEDLISDLKGLIKSRAEEEKAAEEADQAQHEADIKNAEVELKEAQTTLKQLVHELEESVTELEKAQENLETMTSQHGNDPTPENETLLKEAKKAFAQAEKQVAEFEHRVDEAEGSVDKAKLNLNQIMEGEPVLSEEELAKQQEAERLAAEQAAKEEAARLAAEQKAKDDFLSSHRPLTFTVKGAFLNQKLKFFFDLNNVHTEYFAIDCGDGSGPVFIDGSNFNNWSAGEPYRGYGKQLDGEGYFTIKVYGAVGTGVQGNNLEINLDNQPFEFYSIEDWGDYPWIALPSFVNFNGVLGERAMDFDFKSTLTNISRSFRGWDCVNNAQTAFNGYRGTDGVRSYQQDNGEFVTEGEGQPINGNRSSKYEDWKERFGNLFASMTLDNVTEMMHAFNGVQFPDGDATVDMQNVVEIPRKMHGTFQNVNYIPDGVGCWAKIAEDINNWELPPCVG